MNDYICQSTGTYFHAGTPSKVMALLDEARVAGSLVRLFLGDAATGRAWMEENDVLGYISRSMGPIKVSLLMASKRSMDGGAILTHCIVGIVIDNIFVYRHPTFSIPNFSLVNNVDPESSKKYPFGVAVEGVFHAAFESEDKRARWVAFMRGDRMKLKRR